MLKKLHFLVGSGILLVVAIGVNVFHDRTEAAPYPSPQVPSGPPGLIDGAETPELIPDETALNLVLLAIAEPENTTAQQVALARSKIAPATLHEQDTLAFLSIATAFRKERLNLDAQASVIHQRIRSIGSPASDFQKLADLNDQREQLLKDNLSALQSSLSPDGVKKLQAYISREKRGMKIFPEQ